MFSTTRLCRQLACVAKNYNCWIDLLFQVAEEFKYLSLDDMYLKRYNQHGVHTGPNLEAVISSKGAPQEEAEHEALTAVTQGPVAAPLHAE